MSNSKPIPEGYHTVTPYLVVERAAETIEFMKRAFGAKLLFQTTKPDGSIGHSELRIGDSMVMLGSAGDQWRAMPAMIYLYVEDVDAVYSKAIEAGAEAIMPLKDQYYGDRSGGVKDVSGNYWWIATHKEDVTEDEMKRRQATAQATH
ncbi:MAG TPA: VOC family protein [Candidatus Acidoferrales bacterium]|nr:VOC family protein [Candidatus Acidoferrales bacterium]